MGPAGPPGEFFASVFGGPSSAGDSFLAQGADLLAKGYGGKLPDLASPAQPDALTDVELEVLDRARYDDPRAAIVKACELALSVASAGRAGDAAACIARMGSAMRAAEKWHDAHAAIAWAINHAPEDGPIVADAWRRAGSVVADYGEFDDAAELARLSMTAFAELGDMTGAARALVSRGIFLHRAGDPSRSLTCLDSALEGLQSTDIYYRFGAHLTRAYALVSSGDITSGECSADLAENLCTSRAGSISLLWLRARIAAARGDLAQASRLYERTAGELEGSPGDAALVGCDLSRTYLALGRQGEAVETARGLAALAIPQRANRVISAAIRDLWRTASAGELTPRVLEKLIERIRRGRDQRAAAPPARRPA